jgi:hypothetical protein
MEPKLIALTQRRLAELDRLRDMAHDRLGMIARATALLSPDLRFKTMVSPSGSGVEFDRLLRSIRQLMVLEFELRGLFEPPDRDAKRKLRLVKSDRPGFLPPKLDDPFGDLEPLEDLLDIRTDYRRGPLDEVVADIRKTVGAGTPPDDPFAPLAKAPDAVKPDPKPPEYFMRAKPAEPAPADGRSPQTEPALKAATLVIQTLANKGFRMPSKAQIEKHQQSRGPPK